MPEADRRGGHIAQCDAGNDDERGGAVGLLRSLQMHIALPLQLRWVGSLKFLSCGRSPERSPVLRKHSIEAGGAITLRAVKNSAPVRVKVTLGGQNGAY